MLFINLIYFPSIKSTLLGFPKIVIDALVLFPSLDVSTLKVKKNQSYDLTQKFQVEWVVKMPWVELQVDSNGCGKYVKCKICFQVDHKNKLLAPKWDFFQKHASHRKVDFFLKGVKKGEWYIIKDYKHARNEITYACKGKEFVL